MSAYINKETMEYPLHEGDIRLLHPDMGEVFILPDEYAAVLDSQIPTLTETQVFEETTPQLNDDGVYTKVYVVRELDESELQRKAEMRAEYETPRRPLVPIDEVFDTTLAADEPTKATLEVTTD